MIVSIPPHSTDDTAFITALSGCIATIVGSRQPGVVYLLRVTKWFDHKWLHFSGRGRVAFRGDTGMSGDRDTALATVRSTELTFPAFSPRQISSQRTWRLSAAGTYQRAFRLPHPHSRVLQHSAHNLHRRVSDFSDSALFFWFSSGTQPTGVASVLVYGVQEGISESWYASFIRKEQWQVGRTKGIARSAIVAAFPLGAGAA